MADLDVSYFITTEHPTVRLNPNVRLISLRCGPLTLLFQKKEHVEVWLQALLQVAELAEENWSE